MNKPRPMKARALGDLARRCVADAFSRQGFTSVEVITCWGEIVGREIAAHTEPIKIQWARQSDPDEREPGTLVLRVDGPVALEIQHLSPVILARLNGFLGWRAVGRLALRQAPLQRRVPRGRAMEPDPETIKRVAAELADIEDSQLRSALSRLGAAIKRT